MHFVRESKNNTHVNVCDLGSRDEVLSRRLPGNISYLGVDIYPVGPKTVYADISKNIPFGDQFFDYVCALDVIEHTDDIFQTIRELRRVTKSFYIINIPNELHYLARLRLMLGLVSGKYKIDKSSKDRHRWFFTLENVELLLEQSSLAGDRTRVIAFYRWGRWYRFLNRLLIFLGQDGLGAYCFIIVGSHTEQFLD